MKLDDLPKPLHDWLMELEGFHIRIERLYEEAKMDPPARMLDWLLVAYEIGVEEGKKTTTKI
jgi:hypothetical protein